MRRRSFLWTAAAAAVSCGCRSAAQTTLGNLAWVEQDGLWIRQLPGGAPTKIASGKGLHEPRFSDSGRWISYRLTDDKLAVVSSDGRSGASFQAERGAWVGREDRLAIPRENDVDVFGATNGWKIPEAEWKDAGLPVFGPGGKEYAATRVHERRSAADGIYQATAELYTASPEEPGIPKVLLSNEGAIQPYGWTRDGRSILYWRSDDGWSASMWSDGMDLYSIPASGGLEQRLGVTTLAHDDILEFAPKSAGNRLAVTRSRFRETWAEQRIAVVDLDTGLVRDLTAGNVAALCPAWSPDGRSIAYVAGPDAGNIGGGRAAHQNLAQRKLWLLDPDGAAPPRQLTNDPHYRDEEPMWSADGGHILFARMDADSRASLWLMESSSTNAVQVCSLELYDPILKAQEQWFGYYGYIDWRSAFDWRRS